VSHHISLRSPSPRRRVPMSRMASLSRWFTAPPALRMRRSAAHVVLLWTGALGGSGSVFLINVLVARALGPAEFGVYSSVYAISSGRSLAAAFGLAQFWLQAFGEEGWAARGWLRPSLKAQAIVATLAAAGMIGWAEWGPHEQPTRMMLRIMALYLFG